MDTEIQQWFCEICKKKYIFKRKDKHILYEVHINNEEHLELFSDYEDYRLCQKKGFIENMPYLTFSEFLKKRALIDKRLKEEFDRNYKVTE